MSDRGIPGIDTVPLVGRPRSRPPDLRDGAGGPPEASAEAARVVPDLDGPDGDLLAAPLLVVDGRDRAVSGVAGTECAVRDHRGLRLGTVRTRREGLIPRALRLLTVDARREVTRVDVLDRAGCALLHLHRPLHLLKPATVVTDADGRQVGRIVTRKVFTRFCLTLESAADGVVGTVEGQSPWVANVQVRDDAGNVVSRVSRTWEVLARSHHPEHGTYIVQVTRALDEPLRSLALAALLSLETMVIPDVVAGP